MRALAIFLVAAMAAPAAAQLPPASASDIAEAVSGCMAAARPSAVDAAALASEGWARANISREGKGAADGLDFYGKPGNNALILTHPTAGSVKALCAATARIGKQADYQSIVDAIHSLEGVKAIKKDKLQIVFSSGDRLIVSDMTGTREKPSVRIAVMTIEER